MDQKLWREREARCIQEEPPGCVASCPVHVDAREIIAAIQKKDYTAGFSLINKMVPFPRIISRICDEPCRRACTRHKYDEAIAINALEKACIDYGEPPAFINLRLPVKTEKAAVIGGGLSGLTVAVELAKKGYRVSIFEATDALGGSILDFSETRLPRQEIEKDLALLEKLSITINYRMPLQDSPVGSMTLADLCAEYDAVYLGIGRNAEISTEMELELDEYGKPVIDPLTMATSHPKVFAGGSIRRHSEDRSPITSISDGRIAAISIDRLFQNASLTANRAKEGAFSSVLNPKINVGLVQNKVQCADPVAGYTPEEAVREANRCHQCQCLECVKVCPYLAHYRGYPKQHVREIYNNLSIVMGIHHANQMINSCNLCGLCEEVCPGKLNMGEICREARQMMVKKGKMPPSTHDFALRDMQFSTGEKFTLNRHQPGFTSSKMVFFPGCQLSASSPRHVADIYRYLCEQVPGGVGLSLGCCGAPADWAGQEELFKANLQKIEKNWQELGQPKMITGCPSCYSILKREFPQMEVETIWTLFEEIGLPEQATMGNNPKKLAIHDACTIRSEAGLHESIRKIVTQLGHQITELDGHGATTKCCGYGGLQMYADRELSSKAAEERINESEADYLVYCAMCRDILTGRGKRVYHLLDLIFDPGNTQITEGKGPGFSERHENRARLKRTLLREVWGETMDQPLLDVKLIIPETVREKMEDRMILDEDVASVISYAERTGNKFKNTESKSYIAYYKPVEVTYWVEYLPQEDGFLICNTYSHRLEIV